MSDVKQKTTYQLLFDAAAEFTPEGKQKFKKQAGGETDAEFLARLLERVSELPKEQYDQLPEETVHVWFNEAAEAFNRSEALPKPDGFVSAFKAPGAKTTKDEKKVEASRKSEPAQAPKTPAVRKRAEVTVGKIIRRALIHDQSTSATKIRELLATAGLKFTDPTLSSYMSDTLETLRVAAEEGKFVPNPAPAA